MLRIVKRRERVARSSSELHFDPNGRIRDGLLIDVYEEKHRLWTGVFSFGETTYDDVMLLPQSTTIVVVSNGQGYAVNGVEPDQWRAVPSSVLVGSVLSEDRHWTVLYDAWRLYAVWDNSTIGESCSTPTASTMSPRPAARSRESTSMCHPAER